MQSKSTDDAVVGMKPSLMPGDVIANLRRKRLIGRCMIAGVALVLLALFTRVMSEPLRHDEHIALANGWLYGRFALYRQISYAHLPNLPILLSLALHATGGAYKFLVARLITFICWCAFLYAFSSVVWRISKDTQTTALAVLLIVTNSLFVEYEAMLIAVHLFPICFASFGFLFFIVATENGRARPIFVFLAGLFLSIAVGFKANYLVVVPPFAIAAFFVPQSLSLAQRIWRVVVPLALGGVIGGLPTLYYFLNHTDAFLFDVLGYFLGPQRAYWSAPENAATVTGLNLTSRVLNGYRLWTAGSTLLIIVMIIYCCAEMVMSSNYAEIKRRLASWPLLVSLAAAILGITVAFVIAPSFPQYFMPPIPFAVLLLVCLLAGRSDEQRRRSRPLLATMTIATAILGGPTLFQDLPNIVKPSAWEGFGVHKIAMQIRGEFGPRREKIRIATLSPIYALESGLDLYPELASGGFYYRIGDLLSPAQRTAFGITSPKTVGELLEREPPDGILVGYEGVLDKPLVRFAVAHNYRRVEKLIGHDRYGAGVLFIKPGE